MQKKQELERINKGELTKIRVTEQDLKSFEARLEQLDSGLLITDMLVDLVSENNS